HSPAPWTGETGTGWDSDSLWGFDTEPGAGRCFRTALCCLESERAARERIARPEENSGRLALEDLAQTGHVGSVERSFLRGDPVAHAGHLAAHATPQRRPR